METKVDEAAEAEDYDLAEQLQENFEKYKSQNQPKVEKYQILIETMPDES